ncbi:LAFE_0F05930g1_1 [Lachancea fermentati]|uniref:LAFE_0F05930g1_1 n=1 Tax=Lachancea fermentati TaxID=4955 RepID=A0A1G4MF88_LACFM|nr:LAFE_0F05930g1_1 [Lachancea fermentati]
MSTKQIRTCIRDILGYIGDEDSNDWHKGRLKKLQVTTSTLYNVSLSKVMLKQNEEAARCHVCAYLAAEKLSEKYEPDLKYHRDKIPLEPKSASKILDIFRNSILQSSPVKNISWSPSPKKRTPVVNGGRFTAMDPNELRRQLFGTPTKANGIIKAMPTEDLSSFNNESTPENTEFVETRRKLTFEEEDPADEALPSTRRSESPHPLETVAKGPLTASNGMLSDTVAETTPMPPTTPKKRGRPPKSKTPSPKKIRIQGRPTNSKKDRADSNRGCLLYKKYYKVTPAEVIDLCNHFEIPGEVAYKILDQFSEHATYLVFPFQLVCGLVLNCCQIIFHTRRAKDPRIDDYLFKKMALLMKTSDMSEIKESLRIVRELIDGEKWFRALKVSHNYYDGVAYEEAIAIRLGNMLQRTTNLATDEQFEAWKHKIMTDMSLRDG